MKIASIGFFPHRLKRKYRWQTASYTADSVQVLYVKVQGGNGLTGLGATSVMPKADATLQPGIDALEFAAQAIIGREVADCDSLMTDIERQMPGFPRHLVAI